MIDINLKFRIKIHVKITVSEKDEKKNLKRPKFSILIANLGKGVKNEVYKSIFWIWILFTLKIKNQSSKNDN